MYVFLLVPAALFVMNMEPASMSGSRNMSSDVESDGQLVRQMVVSRDPDDGIERTSNKWIAAAYMITAIVGVGVLGVPQAMVYLHWFGLPTA